MQWCTHKQVQEHIYGNSMGKMCFRNNYGKDSGMRITLTSELEFDQNLGRASLGWFCGVVNPLDASRNSNISRASWQHKELPYRTITMSLSSVSYSSILGSLQWVLYMSKWDALCHFLTPGFHFAHSHDRHRGPSLEERRSQPIHPQGWGGQGSHPEGIYGAYLSLMTEFRNCSLALVSKSTAPCINRLHHALVDELAHSPPLQLTPPYRIVSNWPFKQQELSALTDQLSVLNTNLQRKIQARNEYDKTIQETEAAYMKILESSQTLLHVLKRETVNLSKKKQGEWLQFWFIY